ncbi:ankyrin repeat domain-containing protein 27-like [Ischnura elegans]|uniref:ankyrin repeat domain-containing protein 27-like n=1 Tax=Ischnura elegans TaxID=197161 RepID=UPI001ED87861|nr:ankyrin repeat domain-containing protein 27-like [Ischnura elegans]
MECNYDEDLNENLFFRTLQNENEELFHKSTSEGWVICVPRAGSFPSNTLTHDDFFSHILIPSDELPESHFRTLNDKEVTVCNRVVTVESGMSKPVVSRVLFEETYYTDDLLKYRVLCLENPLERQKIADSGCEILMVRTLRDCIDLIWTKSSGGRELLEKMDEAVKSFLDSNPDMEKRPLPELRSLVKGLYQHCTAIVLGDIKLRSLTALDKRLLDGVRTAAETYVLHGVHSQLLRGVTNATSVEDSRLNKTARNLSELQLRDLGVSRSDLLGSIPIARRELARIDGYGTVLGKVGCLRRTVAAIGSGDDGDYGSGTVVAADDLLPVLVFLVIKTGLPNWIAQLTFLRNFSFANEAITSSQADESSFLVTSLEAAIEHVRSGVLLGAPEPEALQQEYSWKKVDYEEKEYDDDSIESPTESVRGGSVGKDILAEFFDQVRLGNVEKVELLLDGKIDLEEEDRSDLVSSDTEAIIQQLCHPLCSCDACERLILEHRQQSVDLKPYPTVLSADGRGLTALHHACRHGRTVLVDVLLRRGASPDASDARGATPLHHAAARGHQAALLLLLLQGKARVGAADGAGNTPLHLAADGGHEGCAKALLYYAEHSGGAGVARGHARAANAAGDTPLHHAARWGYESIVAILLEHGAQPDAQNARRVTPMDVAHNPQVSALLLKASPAPEWPPSPPGTTLRPPPVLDFQDAGPAAGRKASKDARRLGVRPESTEDMRRVEKLLRAVAHGDVRLACYYLGLEGSPGGRQGPTTRSGGTAKWPRRLCHPLCACEACRASVEGRPSSEADGTKAAAKSLEVDVCDADGITPLHAAASHGRVEMVKALVSAGASLDLRTRSGAATPLHLACRRGRVGVARALLEAGADACAADAAGDTALHHCCRLAGDSGAVAMVELLLEHNPRWNVRNAEGKTPLDVAEEKMSLRLVKLLEGKLIT